MSHAEPLLSVKDLSVHFGQRGSLSRRRAGSVRAVDGVSFDIAAGETFGLVGESGSGKSTVGNALLHRVPITAGTVHYDGRDITRPSRKELRNLRRSMQMVFQDPYGSLNPRMKIRDSIAEPLRSFGQTSRAEEQAIVERSLAQVGLPSDAADRYPHAFSGGQRQRVGIARALVLEPRFVVLDEPVAALDTSVQAGVVNLLQDLQGRLGTTFLFIAHDLAVVRHISHRLGIMYGGQLVEMADRDSIYDTPRHPYTRALLSAVPSPDPPGQAPRPRIVLSGEMPDPSEPSVGCRFADRCPFRRPERCSTEQPTLRNIGERHLVACHWADELVDAVPSTAVGPALPVVTTTSGEA